MAPSGAAAVLGHFRCSELTAFRLVFFAALRVTPQVQFGQETVKESISKPSCSCFGSIADVQTCFWTPPEPRDRHTDIPYWSDLLIFSDRYLSKSKPTCPTYVFKGFTCQWAIWTCSESHTNTSHIEPFLDSQDLQIVDGWLVGDTHLVDHHRAWAGAEQGTGP